MHTYTCAHVSVHGTCGKKHEQVQLASNFLSGSRIFGVKALAYIGSLPCAMSVWDVLTLPGLVPKIFHLAGTWAARRCTGSCREGLELLGPAVQEIQQLLPRRVLVIGGHFGQGHGPHEPLTTAELFDPGGEAWETMPGPQVPRSHSTAAACRGVVFVLGGRDSMDCTLNSVESFDFSSCQWVKMPALRAARHSAAAVCLGESLFVMGGFDGLEALDSVERIDCQTLEHHGWMPVQSLSFPRGKHAAVAFQRQIFLLGGMDSGYRCLVSAEALPLIGACQSTWAKLPNLRFARSECAASAVAGAVVVIGGVANGWTTLSNAERFEPAVGHWEVLLDMAIIRRDCASAAVAGELYVMGGMSFGGRCTSKVERLDRLERPCNCWQDVAPLPGPRCGCCAATIQL